jgi:RNA polymerase sigma factor (sigma-70 family)
MGSNPPPDTRPSLLLRVRDASDAESWRQFETAYGDLILRYCRRRGLQLADAEDVRQIVLTKLARALRHFEYDPARGRFRDYLGLCVRNTIATEVTRHRPPAGAVSTMDERALPGAVDTNGDALWHEEWVQHHYRRALRTLRQTCDEHTLQVFEALVCGRPAEEISAAYSVTPASIRKIKQRMRDRLKELIVRQIDDEELAERKPG